MKNYSVSVNLNGKPFQPADWQIVATTTANNKDEACDKVRRAAFSGEENDVNICYAEAIPVSKRGATMKAEI